MKKIKSLICILLTLGIMLFICSKPDVVLANNHTLCTVTSFGFIDHHARVNVDFMGYENTTILRVDVKIEKQDFLFFTETVVSASYDSQGETYQLRWGCRPWWPEKRRRPPAYRRPRR